MSDSTRIGHWFQTWSGRAVWPLDPRPGDIDIMEIAQALSRICRFGGHVSVPHYSVAQHSVIVSELVPADLRFIALLHDASEAYVGDMVRPLKRSEGMEAYSAIEKRWALMIGIRFGLGDALVQLPPEVKHADEVALMTEKRDVLSPNHSLMDWGIHVEPSAKRIDALPQRAALDLFLSCWDTVCPPGFLTFATPERS